MSDNTTGNTISSFNKEDHKGPMKFGIYNATEEQTIVAAEECERKTSVTRTVMNAVAAMVGLGILGLPVALSEAGYVLGGVFILGCALFAAQCAVLLSDAMTMGNPRRVMVTYAELGQYAMGSFGKYIAHISVYGTCLGASILFLILANSMAKATVGEDVMSDIAWSSVNAAILLPFIVLKNFHSVSYVAAVGVLGSVVSSVICLVLVFIELSNQDSDANIVTEAFGDDFQKAITSFSTFAFSFGGAAIFPEMQRVMKDPRSFPKATYISFAVILAMYLPMAYICYFVLGKDILLDPSTDGNVVNALQQNWGTTVLYAFVWVAVMASFIVLILPVFRSVEGAFKTATMPENKELAFRLISRFIILAFCWFISILIPFFGDLMSFLGATTVTATSFLLPIIFWAKLLGRDYYHNSSSKPKAACVLIWYGVVFLFALIAGVISGVNAVRNIIDNWDDYALF
eukprot:Nk52_evm3s533 gene=Nk52_evmTU3s533